MQRFHGPQEHHHPAILSSGVLSGGGTRRELPRNLYGRCDVWLVTAHHWARSRLPADHHADEDAKHTRAHADHHHLLFQGFFALEDICLGKSGGHGVCGKGRFHGDPWCDLRSPIGCYDRRGERCLWNYRSRLSNRCGNRCRRCRRRGRFLSGRDHDRNQGNQKSVKQFHEWRSIAMLMVSYKGAKDKLAE